MAELRRTACVAPSASHTVYLPSLSSVLYKSPCYVSIPIFIILSMSLIPTAEEGALDEVRVRPVVRDMEHNLCLLGQQTGSLYRCGRASKCKTLAQV